jgi:hypothetical protein
MSEENPPERPEIEGSFLLPPIDASPTDGKVVLIEALTICGCEIYSVTVKRRPNDALKRDWFASETEATAFAANAAERLHCVIIRIASKAAGASVLTLPDRSR